MFSVCRYRCRKTIPSKRNRSGRRWPSVKSIRESVNADVLQPQGRALSVQVALRQPRDVNVLVITDVSVHVAYFYWSSFLRDAVGI